MTQQQFLEALQNTDFSEAKIDVLNLFFFSIEKKEKIYKLRFFKNKNNYTCNIFNDKTKKIVYYINGQDVNELLQNVCDFIFC